MGLLLKGLGGGAGGLVLGGLGNQIQLTDDDALRASMPSMGWVGKRKIWQEEAWWNSAQMYSVKAGVIGINKKEILIPTFNSVSRVVYDDPLTTPVVKAEYKWSKRFKAGLKDILISALRVIRKEKGS